jgi:hypothetical protein
MKKYVGTKIVIPTPMNRLEYTNYRGWVLPGNEDGSDEGYLIEYTDGGEPNHPDHKGYISWTPKAVFDSSHKKIEDFCEPCKAMTFGQAIDFAKRGFKIARSGWNGSGMFAYIVSEGTYPAKSAAVKGIFADNMVPYRAYWALKTAQNDVAPWAPSGSDSLAEDWEIVL